MENREKELPMPDPHVDGGTGVKIIVYNTKKKFKGRDGRKKIRKMRERERKRERESKRVKKYNSKNEEFSTLSHSTRTGPRILLACVRM